MIGFLVGTLCLIALVRVLRRGRGGGGCGHGRGHGGGGGRGRFRHDGPDFDLDGQRDPRRGEGGDWSEHPYRGGPPSDGPKDGPRDHWQRHEQDFREGRDHDHGQNDDRGSFGGLRGKAILWEAFRRLDTTPGQEKAIRGVIDDLRARKGAIRDELKKARGDAARAMRGEQWDENALGEALGRIDTSVDAARKAIVEAMAKTHEVLDDKQRNILADLIERGGFRGFGGGRGRRGWS